MKVKLLLFSAIAAAFCHVRAETFSLDDGWMFAKSPETIPLARAKAALETGGAKVEDVSFDDSKWEKVSVPHAINAHDSFDGRAVDAGESSFWRGMAFYRKRFSLACAPEKAFISFETVRQSVYLWVNGSFAGYYEAGIAPVAFDVTKHLQAGENLLCVATDNCAARGTKTFTRETVPGRDPGDMSGSPYQWNTTDFNEVQGGLTGHVKLHLKKKVYLTLPCYNNLKTVGQYVSASGFDFKRGRARITVEAETRNESGAAVGVTVGVTVKDASGKALRPSGEVRTHLAPASDAGAAFLTALEPDVYSDNPEPTGVKEPETEKTTVSFEAEGLIFWSPDTPKLYDVTITLMGKGGEVLDEETVRTGFREVKYDAGKGGLVLNGEAIWLTGYAQRSTDEWAAIGVAPDWLQAFDATLIRKSNANFIRWMHVAPKPAPVRAYDANGIVNVCPAGDKEGDVAGRQWAQRVEAMRDAIIYFRNSPSIFFWEAGNNQISPAHMKEMREMKERLDPGNGRFMGCRTLQTPEQIRECEYVGTMLHRHEMPAFHSMEKLKAFKPIMETEYARQESPRRVWDDYTPPHYDYVCRFLAGGKKETGFDVYDQTQEDFALSTAKEYAAFWSSRANGEAERTYSSCAALCWTDSNQHGRQSGSENCRSSGRVDAVRIPKMNYFTYRAMQSGTPAVKIVGHWNYPKLTKDSYRYEEKTFNGKWMEPTGKILQRDPAKKTVYVIGSPHVAKVELYVNGKLKGTCDKPENLFIWTFPEVDVTESGRVEAMAYGKDGERIASDAIETAGEAAGLEMKLYSDPQRGWRANGADIAVADLKLVDAKGRMLPLASNRVTFTVEGPAVFMGGYNSGVWDEASPIGKDWIDLECGENRVFLRAGRNPGKVVLKAACDNGMTARAELALAKADTEGGLAKDPLLPQMYVDWSAKKTAPVVQSSLAASNGALPWEVRVNGTPVRFPGNLGSPFRPDGNTGVCCAFEPVLEALVRAGAKLEYTIEHKKIPRNKKWLRRIAPTPYLPMVTVKAGGHEIDACTGFTELFIDNGRDKDLTNCEVWNAAKKKAPGVVCGELSALVGYIPGVEIKVDDKSRFIELTVK
ncbi:MAG: beta galactosidase jelly roll domain-containing protein [Kiritimatiellae bacterium]|nr:beta galactosidase jelly roll domain-containing protein [Kiritimatiellia bacterium]